MRAKITFVQQRLFHYRVAFYERLREVLDREDIELALIHGPVPVEQRNRDDAGHLEWATIVAARSLHIADIELVWQPCLDLLRDADLVIVQQENKLLLNYLLLARRLLDGSRLAYFGHGVNRQSPDPKRLREKWKRLLLKTPDWWFAYTRLTANLLLEAGYPSNKITVVQNATDTEYLAQLRDELRGSDLDRLRGSLKIGSGPVGVYCGSLYDLKRIDFLIDAAREIRGSIRDFELVVIGAGPDKPLVDSAALKYPWIHPVGARTGRDLGRHLALGDVCLNPGIVGLSVLDAFVYGMPVITTDCAGHGPEIAYLENNRNGIITPMSVEKYAQRVVGLFESPTELQQLSKFAEKSAKNYTTHQMADLFCEGICGCLGLARLGSGSYP